MASGQCACFLEQALEKVFPVWCYVKGAACVHFGLDSNSRRSIFLKLLSHISMGANGIYFYVSGQPSLALGNSPKECQSSSIHLSSGRCLTSWKSLKYPSLQNTQQSPGQMGHVSFSTTSCVFPAKSGCLMTWIVWWPSAHLPVLHHLP